MTLDPTLEEMESFLRQNTGSMIDWSEYVADYQFKIAAHYFASHHYSGEHSNLYLVICRIDYHSCNEMELEDEPDDEVHMMYDLLVKQYVK
jgi:hypothetical protein